MKTKAAVMLAGDSVCGAGGRVRASGECGTRSHYDHALVKIYPDHRTEDDSGDAADGRADADHRIDMMMLIVMLIMHNIKSFLPTFKKRLLVFLSQQPRPCV
eukprot:3240954-Rhodomonas_salina.1